ncbi:MAG: MFS transporter [Candidatus Abyssobacteria bacterium SURF_17]|uniref:MFS transporter n=1 Tax=Candidatus Abyssobacteria bacterium SURF_17 TaxID=2093361 RepID=A0A419F0X4_9BACT|nr:MAG: MFS transporter [Candidatus Abyssubacteria bacterium SURF_17]
MAVQAGRSDISAAEERFDELVRANFRWNFAVNIMYGLFGTTGWRLIFVPTFVPDYMFKLGGSNFIVGLLLAVGGASRFLTPPLIAPLVEHQPLIKRKAVLIGALMRSQVLLMALGGFFFAPRLNLISFFIFYSLFNMFLGMQNVVYNTVMAKVIPVDRRGRFIGLREFLGGMTAVLVALVAGSFIGKLEFPHGYAATYLLAFFLTSAGLAFFAFSREPSTPVVLEKIPFARRIRSFPKLLSEDKNFANYCICRAVGSLALMSNPFFILYVGSRMSVSGYQLGQVTSLFFLAQTCINLFFGRIADQSGFRRVFIISVTVWMLAMLLLMVIPPSFVLVAAVFMMLGAGMSGFNMSMSNMVLEFGDTSGLPMRLAMVNSVGELATAFGPLLAGFLADNVSYKSVFSLSILCTALALAVMYSRVQEPRYVNSGASGS